MITQDDVLYMIVTDRFADGDPANNGDVDRSDLDRRHGGGLADRPIVMHRSVPDARDKKRLAEDGLGNPVPERWLVEKGA